jgi:putative hydrolase of the HAD superfamily
MILSEDAGINKPHKQIFDFALINTNSRRSQSLMIGDSWDADIAGAYNAGMDQLWYNPEGLPSKGFEPTYTIRRLIDIKEIL